MILIVGLGNPGKKYQKTRHNAGFMILDKLQKSDSFSDWKLKKKAQAEISEGILDNEKIILAKPQTFMNKSGLSVKFLFKFHTLDSENLIIIHDDLDLRLGTMKIVKNRNSAGHKGVQSVINELGTKDFIRFRLGIMDSEAGIKNTEKFVLEKFSKEEEKILEGVINKTCKAVKAAIKNNIEKVMTEYNK